MFTHARRYASVAFTSLFLTAAAGGLGACASSDKAPGPTGEPEEESSDTPFTAKQIRAAMPTGSHISLRREDEKGKVTMEEWDVTEATSETCTIAMKVFAEDGTTLIEDKGSVTSTWKELRDHAKFPADKTVRNEGTITVPVGQHDTWLYIVTTKTDDGKELQTYYVFAKALPGPPVQTSVLVDGKVTSKTTMVGRK